MNQLEWYYENMEIPSKAKKKGNTKRQKYHQKQQRETSDTIYNISPTKLSEQKIFEISVRQ